MNKKLWMLACVTMFALTSCEISLPFNLNFGNKAAQAVKELKERGAILSDFQGHKIVTKVKNGAQYYLGVYRKNEDLMRFFNGDYHRDNNGFYPFYMGTTSGTLDGAVKVTVETIDKDTFGLKVTARRLPWDGKYIGVYSATSSFDNFVVSIALLDSPTQTTFDTIVNHQNTKSTNVKCSGAFKFYDYYEGMPACSPGINFNADNIDIEDETSAKFIGTGHNANVEKGEADYTSMDAKVWSVALEPDSYDLMHLYEI